MKVVIRFTGEYEDAPGAIRMFSTPETNEWAGWSMRCRQLSEEQFGACVWGLVLEPQPPSYVGPGNQPMVLLQALVKDAAEWQMWLDRNVEFIDFDGVRFFKGTGGKVAVRGVRDWQREEN